VFFTKAAPEGGFPFVRMARTGPGFSAEPQRPRRSAETVFSGLRSALRFVLSVKLWFFCVFALKENHGMLLRLK
jgi:hypothetical protein